MSAKITENEIETFCISLLEILGYKYIYAPDIEKTSKRPSLSDVILKEQLTSAVGRINPNISASAREDAIKQIERIGSTDLMTNNETFHRMLTEYVNVNIQKDRNTRGELVKLIDFENPENNDFFVLNQFTVIEKGKNKRPDVILFINGLPLVLIELKNPVNENATMQSAFRQIQTYKQEIPTIFTYNGFVIISDGLEAKVGTVSSGFNRFMTWKTSDGKQEASHLVPQLEILINGMLNKKTILDLLKHFIVFEKSKKEDEKGIITIHTEKKLASYHQYYAVNKAVESTILASNGDKKAGVIWHTQGSGKSLSMVFYTGKIVLNLDNPTVLVITDRNDLDDQLFNTFASSKQLLRQDPVQAENSLHLKTLLKVDCGGIVFATIQKFQPEEGNIYDELSNRKNIVVIADEAHRTQYGFKAKTIDDKDENNNVIGKKIVYGFAKYMRDALPNATYLGFTGTPIEQIDKNTPAVFGNYIDIYDIAQAVEDGATVKIYYESRLAKINISEEGKILVSKLDKELDEDELTENQKEKAKWTQLEALIGSSDRIKHLAEDIINHFEQRQEVFTGKAMIVSMSRRIAADLYREIINIRPEWHSDDLKKGIIKVVMTSASSDGPEISKHHTNKDQRRILSDRMKNPDDELKIVIVRDMWLTGFDAPCMHTLYIDKPMKGHNLMQAIARVNRVYKDKPAGLIVDYLGIASDLKYALSFYSDSGGRGDPAINQEQAVQLMLEKLEIVSDMFHGFNYKNYFYVDTSKKLYMLREAEEFILGLEDGRRRYINEVTALSQAFSIAIPHEEAMRVKDEVSFFQAVKAILTKFDNTGLGKSDEELETTIRQVINDALITDKVIDIYDAAGIKKPDVSILSDEFLLEVKNMEHKNIAYELLKKLLNDDIKVRIKKNLVQSKKLMEMLEKSIKKYHLKILTATEVIEELIKLSQEIKNMNKEAKEIGLTDYEYAFYTAVANNESAMELMQKDKLKELATVLFQRVKEKATIDWTIKENVRAGLKVIIKRTLRQFGYPPDMELLATDTVLKQAELIAEEIINNK